MRGRRNTTPDETVCGGVAHSRNGFPTNMGLQILEAGDRCGDEVASVADATSDGGGLEDDDSPEPDVRARLEGQALLTLLRGTGDGARGPICV